MKNNKKIILGLVGEIASGKDTVADYLVEKYGAKTISFSQPLRDILDILYQPQNRANMAGLGDTLREQFGQDLLSCVIAKKIKNSRDKIIVLPNVRLESDIVYLKKLPGFVLVSIDTEAKTRFKRLTSRGQNTDDKTKTWAQFQKDAQLYTERGIRDLMKKCKYKLDNNKKKTDLYNQIETLLQKI